MVDILETYEETFIYIIFVTIQIWLFELVVERVIYLRGWVNEWGCGWVNETVGGWVNEWMIVWVKWWEESKYLLARLLPDWSFSELLMCDEMDFTFELQTLLIVY